MISSAHSPAQASHTPLFGRATTGPQYFEPQSAANADYYQPNKTEYSNAAPLSQQGGLYSNPQVVSQQPVKSETPVKKSKRRFYQRPAGLVSRKLEAGVIAINAAGIIVASTLSGVSLGILAPFLMPLTVPSFLAIANSGRNISRKNAYKNAMKYS